MTPNKFKLTILTANHDLIMTIPTSKSSLFKALQDDVSGVKFGALVMV